MYHNFYYVLFDQNDLFSINNSGYLFHVYILRIKHKKKIKILLKFHVDKSIIKIILNN